MTMLTHAGTRFKPASYLSGRRGTAGATPVGAYLAAFKQFCVCAVAVLIAGGAVAGIIAVRTAAGFLLWLGNYWRLLSDPKTLGVKGCG